MTSNELNAIRVARSNARLDRLSAIRAEMKANDEKGISNDVLREAWKEENKFISCAVDAISESKLLVTKFGSGFAGAVELASRIEDAYQAHEIDELLGPYVLPPVADDTVLVNAPIQVPADIEVRLSQEGIEHKWFDRGLYAATHCKSLSAKYGAQQGLDVALKIARAIQEFHHTYHTEMLINDYAASLWERDQKLGVNSKSKL